VTIYHSETLTSASIWSMDTFLTQGSRINIEKMQHLASSIMYKNLHKVVTRAYTD